jgi:sugar phosphate isomerase/epimerase
MRSALVAFLIAGSFSLAAPPEFFAFDNGVGRGTWTPEQQASTLKELGYDGISYNYTKSDDLAVWLETFKAHGLKIYGLYVHTFPDGPEPYDTDFRKAIKMLKGSDTVIWMTLREGKDKKRNYDAESVRIVQDIADQAATNSLRVAIYPHAGFYVACAADSLRIASLADRPNVGASINLCHEFMTGNGDRLDETLKLAAPFATLVSINGVDVVGKKYILRLDRGNFDVAAYLEKLLSAGYRGPVGLQCYSVPGDPRENLKRSMEVWKKVRPK